MDNENQYTPPAEPVTPEPVPAAPVPQPKSHVGLVLVILLVVVVAAAAAGFGGYTVSKSKADKDKTQLNNKITVLESNNHELPAGSVKESDCIPNMGSHYMAPGADHNYGPFILVNKQGKVIGIEYMASADMYTPIPGTNPPVELLNKDSPMYGWKFDHVELSHLPKGHEGFLKDHIDVHLFTVTPEEQKQACI